jgi:hypothetical protein
MNALHLSLKKRWFEMIACGEKKEEYREIKLYWIKRFMYDVDGMWGLKDREICDVLKRDLTPDLNWNRFIKVIAKNGYSKTSPIIHWEHLGITIGEPNPSWCEAKDVGKKVFILKIGDILYDNRRV